MVYNCPKKKAIKIKKLCLQIKKKTSRRRQRKSLPLKRDPPLVERTDKARLRRHRICKIIRSKNSPVVMTGEFLVWVIIVGCVFVETRDLASLQFHHIASLQLIDHPIFILTASRTLVKTSSIVRSVVSTIKS